MKKYNIKRVALLLLPLCLSFSASAALIKSDTDKQSYIPLSKVEQLIELPTLEVNLMLTCLNCQAVTKPVSVDEPEQQREDVSEPPMSLTLLLSLGLLIYGLSKNSQSI